MMFTAGVSAEVLVDPTKPLPKAVEKSSVVVEQAESANEAKTQDSISGIRLSAVFISPDKRYAMINGHAHYVGQNKNNIIVKSISHRSVDVIHDGEYKTLTLKKVMKIREHEDKF